MEQDDLPRYLNDHESWPALCGRALTDRQADTLPRRWRVRGVTTGYCHLEREALAKVCAEVGDDHFLVSEAAGSVSVFRVNCFNEEDRHR